MSTLNNDDLLTFQDFTPAPTQPQQQHQSDFPNIHSSASRNQNAAMNSQDDAALNDLILNMSRSAKEMQAESPMDGAPESEQTTGSNFLTIEYYQQFFNVDTSMVVDRIVSAIIPKRASASYLKSTIGLNPDLYGPFWIVITLIFSIAISGNIASYLQRANEGYVWRYNFHLVSYAATAIFIYACFVPAALWGTLRFTLKPVADDMESESSTFIPSLLSLVCVYGYSLAIYVPVSILWVIPFSILQWLLVIVAAVLSGSVLVYVLTPAIRNSNFSLFLLIGIAAAHFLLAAGFMLYFFHVPSSEAPEVVKVVTEKVVEKLVTVAQEVKV